MLSLAGPCELQTGQPDLHRKTLSKKKKKATPPPQLDDTLFPGTLSIHCTEFSIHLLVSLPSLFLSPSFVSPSQAPIINYDQLSGTQLSVVCEFPSSQSLNKNSKAPGSGWLCFFSTLALWKAFHPSQTYFNIPVSILLYTKKYLATQRSKEKILFMETWYKNRSVIHFHVIRRPLLASVDIAHMCVVHIHAHRTLINIK